MLRYLGATFFSLLTAVTATVQDKNIICKVLFSLQLKPDRNNNRLGIVQLTYYILV